MPETPKEKRNRELAEFRLMLDESPLTVRYLWRIMETCKVFQDAFDPDPYQTARNLGMRLSGQLILEDFTEGAADVLARLMMNPPVDPPVEDDDESEY